MSFDGLGRWAWADGLGLEDVLMAFEPMAVLMVFAAAILDSGVRIGNRCKLFPGFGPGAAVILDFKARLGNRCRFPPRLALVLQ